MCWSTCASSAAASRVGVAVRRVRRPGPGRARAPRRAMRTPVRARRFHWLATASPSRVGSPAITRRPPGRSTRRASANAPRTSGRWCATACPITRSNESSANGSASASARRPSTVIPRRAPLATQTSTMPCEMSVACARSTTPPCARLSRKNPVPQPISSTSPNALAGPRHGLAEPPERVVDAALVEADRPLVVVVLRFPVVVADVGVLGVDRLGAHRWLNWALPGPCSTNEAMPSARSSVAKQAANSVVSRRSAWSRSRSRPSSMAFLAMRRAKGPWA